MKKFTSFLFTMAAAMSVQAASTIDFTYNRAGGEVMGYGFNKIETINVAIRINEPALVGAQITSMSVPVTTDLELNVVGECSAFLSTKLDRAGAANVADICTETATIDDKGVLTCTFSEPYTITEEGVYVGYTMPFSARSADLYPIAVAEGENADGLYILASRSCISWQAKSEALGAVSAMAVTITGEFPENGVGVTLDSSYNLVGGEENEVTFRMSNYGTNAVSSFDYSYKIGSLSGTGSKELAQTINGVGAFAQCSVPVNVPAEIGQTTMEFTVTKVNGAEISPVTSYADVNITPFKLVNRPVAEEFTGLWCGWCPRGYAAMETLKEAYGSDFTGLAYHDSDPMATISKYPISVSGYPTATVNRAKLIDAGEILTAWPAAAAKSTNSNVEVEIDWANEEKTIIRATVKVRFLEDQKGSDYRIGACLVADGMTNPKWGQNNSYSNQGMQSNELLNELFVGKASIIYGLPFNDVVISFPNLYGLTTGIPADIKQYETVTYTEEFDLNACRNLETFFTNPIQDIEKLRVVGILFDKNGYPLNSATSDYSTAGGETDRPKVGAPVITGLVPAKNGQPAEITFTCPTTYGGQEGILKPNDTPIGSNGAVTSYFRVALYVDGKPYTFKMSDYLGLKKNETTLVFGNREIGNTSFADNQMTIKVFVDEASTFGVQSCYVYGTTTLESDITSIDANEELAIIAVESTSDVPTTYYDLQGRRVSAPRAGQLLIVKSAEGTKKIRY